jgi:hypothetical protein
VYARVVDEDTLTFGVSGKLWKDALVMYDHQSHSLWAHVTGEAISGLFTGKRLESYPAMQTTWQAWVTANPETKVLSKPKLSQSVYEDYKRDPERMGIHGRRLNRSLLPGKTSVVGFHLIGVSYAIPLDSLDEGSIIQPTIEGIPLLIFTDKGDKGITIWYRKQRNHLLQFSLVDDATALAKADDGRIFDLISGQSTDGDMRLKRVQAVKAYWFGWHNFFPDTKVFMP